MGDRPKKQVKVDNWGMFFLQRLQQQFARSEFCDFTLQFSNNEQVKVHRLVLDVCTEYFRMLEKQNLVSGDCIRMPSDMQSDVVIPVINFMYTGRLEFRADQQQRLYLTAQKMKMTVLTKLLDAQKQHNQPQPIRPKPQEIKPPVARIPITKISTPVVNNSYLQGKKITPRVIDPNLPQMLPGRKLPVWTRRTFPAYTATTLPDFDRPIRLITQKFDNTPRPTRFEWPDEDEDAQTNPLTTTFEDISYESKPLLQLKESYKPIILSSPRVQQATTSQRAATFEEVLRTGATKRASTMPLPVDTGAKKLKMLDMQVVKEYTQEAQVRKNMNIPDDSDEDVDNDLSMMDDVHDGHDQEEEDDEDEDEAPFALIAPQKSILKSQGLHDEDSVNLPGKKVRFSLDSPEDEAKENEAKVVESRPMPTRAGCNIADGAPPTVTNHAKIITEVLKKYPHLVKNNKNIRLKIMQRGQSPNASTERDAQGRPPKAKVSYVVLKSDVVGAKNKSTLGIKHGGLVEQISSLNAPQAPLTGAENVTGPWLCHSCGTNEEPINFETYFDYRHHLQDVHNEKIDARICEHCGHRASKRNLLLYHQYTKHGIAPPRNCQFPKCDQCEYVALSESLLIKHRNNHLNNKDFMCKVCNATFKSNGALQGHMQTNLHSDPYKKVYECPHCQKTFVRNINLKVHLRQSHKDEPRQFDDDELDELEEDMIVEESEGQVMEVPVTDMMNPGMTILAEAPSGFERSSEAEGLDHVASGIATSLGLTDGQQTVILLDDNQEYIIQTTDIDGNEYLDGSTLIQEVQEYIVPEIAEEIESFEPQEESIETEVYSQTHHVHGSEDVLMVLTDHCYAEEVVTKEETHESYLTENQEEHNSAEMIDEDVKFEPPRVGDNIEAMLESFEAEEPQSKPRKKIFTSRTPTNFKKGVTNLPSIIKTYSPTKKPITHVINTQTETSKPVVGMSVLLDEWDEDLSQDDQVSQSIAIATPLEALPTRGHIPEEIFAVQQPSAIPTETFDSSMLSDELSYEPKAPMLTPEVTEQMEVADQIPQETYVIENVAFTEGAGPNTTLDIASPLNQVQDHVVLDQTTTLGQKQEQTMSFSQEFVENTSMDQGTQLESEIKEKRVEIHYRPELEDHASSLDQGTSEFQEIDNTSTQLGKEEGQQVQTVMDDDHTQYSPALDTAPTINQEELATTPDTDIGTQISEEMGQLAPIAEDCKASSLPSMEHSLLHQDKATLTQEIEEATQLDEETGQLIPIAKTDCYDSQCPPKLEPCSSEGHKRSVHSPCIQLDGVTSKIIDEVSENSLGSEYPLRVENSLSSTGLECVHLLDAETDEGIISTRDSPEFVKEIESNVLVAEQHNTEIKPETDQNTVSIPDSTECAQEIDKNGAYKEEPDKDTKRLQKTGDDNNLLQETGDDNNPLQDAGEVNNLLQDTGDDNNLLQETDKDIVFSLNKDNELATFSKGEDHKISHIKTNEEEIFKT